MNKVLLVFILAAILFVAVHAVSRQKYGQAIFFDLASVSGTDCGKAYKDTDLVAIVSPSYFQSKGNVEHKVCGRKLSVKNIQNGKTVTVEVQDKSKDIKNVNNIGLTKAGFAALGGKAGGRNIKISWHPLSDDSTPGGSGAGDSTTAAPSGGDTSGASAAAPSSDSSTPAPAA